MKRLLSYCWFVLATRLTGLLPDVRPVRRLRGALVSPCFKRCGKRFELCGNVMISYTTEVSIGDDVAVTYGVWIHAVGGVEIGDQVMLGPYTCIASSNHAKVGGSYRFGADQPKRVRIGRGAWTGAHVTITAGTTVGVGAACAAGAVVTHDVPDHAVVAGVPARVLKSSVAGHASTS